MNITIAEADGMADNAYLSVRVGETRRMRPFKIGESFSFPGLDERGFVQFDAYAKLGSHVASGLSEPAAADSPKEIEQDVKIHNSQGAPITAKLKVAFQDVCAPKKSHARHKMALDAKNYMDLNDVWGTIQNMLHSTLKQRPQDPLSYMLEHLNGEHHRRYGRPAVAASSSNVLAEELQRHPAFKDVAACLGLKVEGLATDKRADGTGLDIPETILVSSVVDGCARLASLEQRLATCQDQHNVDADETVSTIYPDGTTCLDITDAQMSFKRTQETAQKLEESQRRHQDLKIKLEEADAAREEAVKNLEKMKSEAAEASKATKAAASASSEETAQKLEESQRRHQELKVKLEDTEVAAKQSATDSAERIQDLQSQLEAVRGEFASATKTMTTLLEEANCAREASNAAATASEIGAKAAREAEACAKESAGVAWSALNSGSDEQGVALAKALKEKDNLEQREQKATLAWQDLHLEMEASEKQLELSRQEAKVATQEATTAKEELELAKQDTEAAKQATKDATQEAAVARQEAEAAKRETDDAKRKCEVAKQEGKTDAEDEAANSEASPEAAKSQAGVANQQLEVARREAEEAKRKAEAAKQGMEDAKREAESAKREAAAAKSEAEAAKREAKAAFAKTNPVLEDFQEDARHVHLEDSNATLHPKHDLLIRAEGATAVAGIRPTQCQDGAALQEPRSLSLSAVGAPLIIPFADIAAVERSDDDKQDNTSANVEQLSAETKRVAAPAPRVPQLPLQGRSEEVAQTASLAPLVPELSLQGGSEEAAQSAAPLPPVLELSLQDGSDKAAPPVPPVPELSTTPGSDESMRTAASATPAIEALWYWKPSVGNMMISRRRRHEGLPDLSGHHSLLADVLKAHPSLYGRLRGRQTTHGVSLERCMKPGLENPGHSSMKLPGLVAGDEECYEVFRKLFDDVIALRHVSHQPGIQHPTDLAPAHISGVQVDETNKYVICSQVRSSRNLSGFCMAAAMDSGERCEVERLMSLAFEELDGEDLQGKYFPLRGSSSHAAVPGGMSQEDKIKLQTHGMLLQRPEAAVQISSGLDRSWPEARGVFAGSSRKFMAWCNSEDHLYLVSMQMGGDLKEAFNLFARAVFSIERSLERRGQCFARNERLGFISACPSNLGTGLRASILLRIPLLSKQPEFHDLCLRLGLTAQSTEEIYGSAFIAEVGTWDISNFERLGISEVDLVNKVIVGCAKLVALEQGLEAGKNPALDPVLVRSQSVRVLKRNSCPDVPNSEQEALI